jgi:hypothetical protein
MFAWRLKKISLTLIHQNVQNSHTSLHVVALSAEIKENYSQKLVMLVNEIGCAVVR